MKLRSPRYVVLHQAGSKITARQNNGNLLTRPFWLKEDMDLSKYVVITDKQIKTFYAWQWTTTLELYVKLSNTLNPRFELTTTKRGNIVLADSWSWSSCENHPFIPTLMSYMNSNPVVVTIFDKRKANR